MYSNGLLRIKDIQLTTPNQSLTPTMGRRCWPKPFIQQRILLIMGRYQGIPRHQSLCQQCSSGEVEDEIHFLFKCSKYEPDRKELIDIILTSCPNFNSLNDVKKLEWICNCENHNILTYLGVFLRKHCRQIFIFFIYLCLSVCFCCCWFFSLDVLLLCLRHEVEYQSYICWTSPEALSLGVCG